VIPHPLIPSPASYIIENHNYCWLERGVKKRGGFAPSQILSPSPNIILNGENKNLSLERGLGGEVIGVRSPYFYGINAASIKNQPDINKPLIPTVLPDGI
jgi:hypothetical protein